MIGARRGIGGPGGLNPLLILGLVLLAYGYIRGGLVSPVQRAADDPVGFVAFIIAIVLAGFGYGKPVPFNESRLRSAMGVTFVALAGPLANLVLAALCAIPLRFSAASLLGGAYEEILTAIVLWNCVLAIFNLVPIPPLDGANVVYGLLPPRQQYSWRTYQQYGPFLLLFILLLAPQILSALVFAPALALARFLLG